MRIDSQICFVILTARLSCLLMVTMPARELLKQPLKRTNLRKKQQTQHVHLSQPPPPLSFRSFPSRSSRVVSWAGEKCDKCIGQVAYFRDRMSH